MRRFLLFVCITAFSYTTIQAQSMTDEQVMQFVMKEREAGTSQSQIVTKLMQNGVNIQQIRRIRDKYNRQIQKSGLGMAADKAVNDASKRMRENNGEEKSKSIVYSDASSKIENASSYRHTYDENDDDYLMMQQELGSILPTDTAELVKQLMEERNKNKKKVFGRDVFNRKDLTFEPNMNIATPQNYRLGPGDAVIIDIYGASQQTFTETVSPDGEVTIEGYGPVQLSGLTVAQANARLRSTLGARYSSSKIKLTVGQTKTMMVNVMGEVKAPGTYTLSAFASVFHALYMAGGTNDLGTLRNIKVFRNNKLVTTVDIYDYMLNGKLTGNVRLADNDVIIVGPYDCLVNITGKIKRPMFYEMKKNESIASLLKYAGSFTGDAYTKAVRVFRKTGREYSVYNVEEFDMSSFRIADGDSVSVDSSVDSILPRYTNTVEVKGAVFRPGMYQIDQNINSVGTLLQRAEGVKEDAFTVHAVMHRMKPDRTLEVIPVDVEGILNGTVADIPLKENDVLFIPTKAEMQVERTITIHGEVNYPGVYKYADNETLEDFVLQAGGLKETASTVKVDVARRISNPAAITTDSVIARTYSFSLKDGFIIDGTSGFTLMPFDEVYVRKSPGYYKQQNIKVEGQVMFAGTYTLSQKNERLSDAIKKAGGVTDLAYIKGARLERRITPDERLRMQTVLRMAQAQKGEKDSLDINKLLREGDRIIVPEYNGTVKISGDVMFPNTVAFDKNKDVKYYINEAGGWGNRAKKSHTYIIYMNGKVARVGYKTKVRPGCEIVVPTKPKRSGALAEWLAIGTSVASFATVIATFANIIKK